MHTAVMTHHFHNLLVKKDAIHSCAVDEHLILHMCVTKVTCHWYEQKSLGHQPFACCCHTSCMHRFCVPGTCSVLHTHVCLLAAGSCSWPHTTSHCSRQAPSRYTSSRH